MYVRSVRLNNIKHIRDLTIDFTSPRTGTPRRLTVLLGRNGTGKTTILRALGLALGGPTAANQLAAPSELIPLPGQRAAAGSGDGAQEVKVSVTVERQGVAAPQSWSVGVRAGSSFFHGDELAAELETARGQGTPGWFVAGYGTNRVLPSPLAPMSLSVPIYGQLGSLFDSLEHGRLVATNFVDLLGEPKQFARAVQRVLKRAALPGLTDVELRGQGGVTSAAALVASRRFELALNGQTQKVPATWLSHGYQSTIAWIVDLLGRVVLSEGQGRVQSPDQVRGVLLLEEIDIHLHPQWQRTILPSLLTAFPNLQIIASTHSPMVVADLHPEEILLLDHDKDGGLIARHPSVPPRLLTAAQLLAEYFGVQRTSAGELHAALDELRRLQPEFAIAAHTDAGGRSSARAGARAKELRKILDEAGVDVEAWLGGRP